MDINRKLASEFNIREKQVTDTVALIDEGNTIPFIARYRKEATGGLSDELLRDLNDRLEYLRGLEERKEEVIRLIDAYDARAHVYFMTSCGALQDQLARLAPDIPRCMGNKGDNKTHPDIVDRAIAHKCQMVQLFKPYFDQSLIDRAHAAGLRVNVFWSDDPDEARKFLSMGVDTILANDYLRVSEATGLK